MCKTPTIRSTVFAILSILSCKYSLLKHIRSKLYDQIVNYLLVVLVGQQISCVFLTHDTG